ncbi:hypothetical protein E1A91_A11G025400v1 [Gossypium mustelinum]|uniref:BTB domain-containing protein n=1 Tax=Gossypium mustelinum TaxID=34275 RepID=A0A5D2X158_GOSMU|nr:hypothetical protein E1A91_A11G025400v1 [Gossypium mustelinum]
MRVLNVPDLFDLSTIMVSDLSPGGAFGSDTTEPDFGFAFNDSNFSDRVLRIEIIPDSPETKSDGDCCSSIADWARNRKRRREDFKKEIDVVQRQEQVLNCNVPDTVDGLTYENRDEDAVAMIEGSPSDVGLNCNQIGNDTAHDNYSSLNKDHLTVLRVNIIHISSPILAAKSPFFYKLFSNGMTESEQRYVTLWVHASDAVQPLADAAKLFLAAKYKDVTKFQDEVLNLPLAGIEAVFSSDDLQVASEDAVYDFLLKWARTHYPKLEERRGVFATRLGRLIRFPHMTCRKLKKVLTCNDFDAEIAPKIVLEALFFKAETPHKQRALASEEANAPFRHFLERAYKYRPVKVLEFEKPKQQCVVYLDLKREECAHLFPGGKVYSQAFHLGGQGFFFSAHCHMDQQSSFHCFGLFLGMQEKGAVTFAVDYEFAARSKPTEDYVSKYKGNYTFTGRKAIGYRNLFGIPWTTFMADDSNFFINGVLHLRAELTVRQ